MKLIYPIYFTVRPYQFHIRKCIYIRPSCKPEVVPNRYRQKSCEILDCRYGNQYDFFFSGNWRHVGWAVFYFMVFSASKIKRRTWMVDELSVLSISWRNGIYWWSRRFFFGQNNVIVSTTNLTYTSLGGTRASAIRIQWLNAWRHVAWQIA
jgi:hypothetical protein